MRKAAITYLSYPQGKGQNLRAPAWRSVQAAYRGVARATWSCKPRRKRKVPMTAVVTPCSSAGLAICPRDVNLHEQICVRCGKPWIEARIGAIRGIGILLRSIENSSQSGIV